MPRLIQGQVAVRDLEQAQRVRAPGALLPESLRRLPVRLDGRLVAAEAVVAVAEQVEEVSLVMQLPGVSPTLLHCHGSPSAPRWPCSARPSGFPELEQEHLLKLWEGSAHVRVLSGPRAFGEDKARMLGSPRLKTLALHDHHYLGPDGLPVKHRVIHVIEAIVDGVDRVPYRADTNALTIEAGQGFSGLAGPVYQPIAELFVVDMLLAKPLAIGETATLEYTASFHYSTPPPPEFRRVVQFHVENLDIRVEFHPDKLPRDVVWAVWDGIDGPIMEREHVTLDSQFAVHRYLRLAEKTTAGFHWDW
jgi:hypothetical protein